MVDSVLDGNVRIHRRAGGLEERPSVHWDVSEIHRRAGGLEVRRPHRCSILQIHRRAGGLEDFTALAELRR